MRIELKSIGLYPLFELPQIRIVTVLILIMRRFVNLSLFLKKALIVFPRVKRKFSQRPHTGVENILGTTRNVVDTLNSIGTVLIQSTSEHFL